MKKGGRVLGKGAHGCAILAKPLNCHNIKTEKLIKLNVSKEDFVGEINNTLLVNFIDKSTTSIKLEDACITDISTLKETDKKHLDECGITSDMINNNKIYQIIYNKKDIGVDLFKIAEKNILPLEKILALSLRLYESLYLYSKYSICFMDIKPENVIYLEKEDKLKFIDYGIISNYEGVLYDEKGYLFSQHDYPYYPPELKLIRSINKKESYDEFYNKFIRNYMHSDVAILSDRLFVIYENFNNDLIDIYKILENIKQENSSTDIQQYFTDNDKSKIHLFSLSMMLLNIISIYDHNKYTIKDKDFVSNFIKNVILPSISFNYKKRISTEEAIKNIKQLKIKDKKLTKIVKEEKLLENIKEFHKKSKLSTVIEEEPTIKTRTKREQTILPKQEVPIIIKKTRTRKIEEPLIKKTKIKTILPPKQEEILPELIKKTKKGKNNSKNYDVLDKYLTEDIKKNIRSCIKTRPYYLILAKNFNIKNRYKMRKERLCNVLQEKI